MNPAAYRSGGHTNEVIIKNVPCEKCSQCGEVVYDGATAMKLDEIAESLKNSLTEIAVVQFPHAA